MYSTLSIELSNGKRDDYSETVYITIHQSTNIWTYHIAWETSGDGYDYAETGETTMNAAEWQETIVAAIEDMITNQTAIGIDEVEDYLADEGHWMVNLTAEDFAPDKWDDHQN